jgi:hypothetical protein
MSRAGIVVIASLMIVGGLTQSAPRLCPLPLRTAGPTGETRRAVNADRPVERVVPHHVTPPARQRVTPANPTRRTPDTRP